MHRSFAAKILLYALPFVVVLLFPVAVLTISGEFAPVERVIELQTHATKPVLFGKAYSDPTATYKLNSVLRRRPEVMALGTSRILAVRSNFFAPGTRFFNAGNGVTRLRHFRPFLERIPRGSEPKVILLGLDQYLFNANFDPLAPDGMETDWAGARPPHEVFFQSWTRVFGDFRAGKFALDDLAQRDGQVRIGLNAMVHANAFRNDGSYFWGQYVADPLSPENPDYRFENTLDRIATGNRRFEYGAHVSEASVAELGRFLDECRARGIHVAAFLPPFAHQIYLKLQSMPREYNYLREVEPRLRPLLESRGYTLHDFSDLASIGASDLETIDGYHGSEKAYLRLFLKMIENDAKLHAVARDPQLLRERLQAAQGDQVVFELGES
jgi:hypothetical protein